jgi:hypothetical protein
VATENAKINVENWNLSVSGADNGVPAEHDSLRPEGKTEGYSVVNYNI